MDTPSPEIIEQRIRNLLFEYVRMVAHYREGEMPGVVEIMYMWPDLVLHPLQSELHYQFHKPVYTLSERMALETVDEMWENFYNATPEEIEDINEAEALATPEWFALVAASKNALEVMSKRGKLPED